MLLFRSKNSLPWLIALSVLVHFSLQFLSLNFYSGEWPLGAAVLYVFSGGVDLLVAAHVFKQSALEKSKQLMLMGIGLLLLGTTFIIVGLGLGGAFGALTELTTNLGMFLLILGTGLAAFVFLLSPASGKAKGESVVLLITSVLLILFIVGLYQIRGFLPLLYNSPGIPSLLRQQLITVVLILFSIGGVRFALSEWGRSPKQSVQWYIIGTFIFTLVMLNFLLSQTPGDGYSWAGRFFQLLASGAFIQYLWWDERGE